MWCKLWLKNNLFIAVILSLSGLFLLDCMGIAIKYLRDDYPAAQLSVFRNLFGMIPCFIVLYFSKDWHANGKKLVIKRWRFGLARGLIMSFAQLCLYTSYLYLPYALVATMEYTGPMMITLLAIPLLGEKFGWYKSLAVLIGFVGILIVLRPEFNGDRLGYLIAFGAGIMIGVFYAFNRLLAGEAPPLVNQTYSSIIGALLLTPFIFSVWVPLRSEDMVLILSFCAIAALGQTCLFFSFLHGEASILAPLTLSQIVFATLFGYLFFNEFPDNVSILGIIVVISSAVYIAIRETRSS